MKKVKQQPDKIRCNKRKQENPICWDCGDNSCRLNYYYVGKNYINGAVYQAKEESKRRNRMRSISAALRKLISDDPLYYTCCIPDCYSRQVQWHHTFIYAGRQCDIIVPVCKEHHDAVKTDKFISDYCKWFALKINDIGRLKERYPKYGWDFEKRRLDKIFLYRSGK